MFSLNKFEEQLCSTSFSALAGILRPAIHLNRVDFAMIFLHLPQAFLLQLHIY